MTQGDEYLGPSTDITPEQLVRQASRLPQVPNVPREPGTHYAVLTTNDLLLQTADVRRMITQFDADGYVVGVGAGNIFNMVQLFPEGRSPKGIIGADVMPEVVLAGRVVVDLLQRNRTPEEFLAGLGNVSYPYLEGIIQNESSSMVQQRFRESLPFALGGLQAVKSTYDEGIARDYSSDLSYVLLKNLISRYGQMKALADQGKIAFVMQDITDPAFIGRVTALKDYKNSKNIIYVSNVADIITQRGQRDEEFTRLDTAQKALKPTRRTRNMYVFTSQRLPHPPGAYRLRLSLSPPDRTQYFGSGTRRGR